MRNFYKERGKYKNIKDFRNIRMTILVSKEEQEKIKKKSIELNIPLSEVLRREGIPEYK